MRVQRLMTDFAENARPLQAGCRILDDGEGLAEVWIEVGPFDSLDEAMGRAVRECIDLADGQIVGQARLWDAGPVI